MTDDRKNAPGATGDDDFPDEAEGRRDRAELEALLAGTSLPRDPEVGSVVHGIVVQIGPDDVFVDVGAKSEATIAREELLDESGALEVRTGDRIEASVVSSTDGVRLSRRMLKSAKARGGLLDAHAAGIPVEGRVEAVRKGGFDIALAGNTRAFCPLSQIDERRVADPQGWVGRTLEFKILEIDPKLRNVVVSRRKLLEADAAERAEKVRERLREGLELEGRVVSLQSYGAFVDLGGLQGLLHVSEISHARLSHPSEVLKPGDTVRVRVLKIDTESGKVSLTRKEFEQDPWADIDASLQVGLRLDGRITRALDFGAFVELKPGVEGLLHVSELAPGKKAADARKLVEAGTVLQVQILDIDKEQRRISLGRVDEGAPDAEAVEPGAVLRGTVERIEPFGVFVRLGPGKTGLVPNEELGIARGGDVRKELPVGAEIEVEVVSIEEGGRRIRLSRSAVAQRSEREEIRRYQASDAEDERRFSTMADAFRKRKRNEDD